MVESAIVLPLFVFMILGLLQLGLMQQAKTMTKYAAYRAARTGSLLSGQHSAMERAALQVLLPFAVKSGTPPAGSEHHFSTPDAARYVSAWQKVRGEMDHASPGELHYVDPARGSGSPRTKRYLDVIVCHRPTGMGGTEPNFDNPFTSQGGGYPWMGWNGGGWSRMNSFRFSVQVSFYYRMPIPFVNRLLWHLAQGNEAALQVAFEITRTGPATAVNTSSGAALIYYSAKSSRDA